jgi:hypothetical protein
MTSRPTRFLRESAPACGLPAVIDRQHFYDSLNHPLK